MELGSGPAAPMRPPANSIEGVTRPALVARELEGAFANNARVAVGATKASVEATMARAEAANAVFILQLLLSKMSNSRGVNVTAADVDESEVPVVWERATSDKIFDVLMPKKI